MWRVIASQDHERHRLSVCASDRIDGVLRLGRLAIWKQAFVTVDP
jgi:hypothetical protein